MLKNNELIPLPRFFDERIFNLCHAVDHTIWRVVDSHWVCIFAEHVQGKIAVPFDPEFNLLCDYLSHYGFDIPECIDYCLASNDDWSLKFSHFGNNINIYIREL